MTVEHVELFGKQPRNKRPLRNITYERLLDLHNYFVNTPPALAVEGMNLDRDMIGPPITTEDLQHLIPSHRVVLNEMRLRGILIDRKFK
jgi:hypothetical protein